MGGRGSGVNAPGLGPGFTWGTILQGLPPVYPSRLQPD